MKNKILIIIFVIFIYGFMFVNILTKDKEISKTERRKLAKFPEYKLTTEYPNKLEKYLLDQFSLRDSFREIKSYFSYNIYKKLENNNISLKDNYIFKSDYPTNNKSIDNYISYVEYIKTQLTENNRLFMAVVPDKNYYLNDDTYLNIDYEKIYDRLNELNVNKIDLRNILTLEDYYETDTHWKQQNLFKIIKELSKYLNYNYEEDQYKLNIYDDFYGVYYGSAAIKRNPEKLIYLTSEIINSAKVNYFENKNLSSVYNISKLSNLDSYDVFLDGASSFIEINTDYSTSDKELVIFRDSFGSSISPLLIKYYKKITIIDNRYISSKYYTNMIEFNNQDVLILNSTLLVNSSSTLKF